jgi:hypothetical protein
MESAPPNYNPNDSMLSGGTESIMKVMGGGSIELKGRGGSNNGLPHNYNETQSVLSGGIEPIVRVEGGGNIEKEKEKEVKEKEVKEETDNETDISIRYVAHYDFEDNEAKEIYTKFIQTLGSNDKILNLNASFEREIKRLDESNQPIHYVSKPYFIQTRMSNTNTKVQKTKIKFIPESTREIIVLPAVKGNTEEFFKQILFLRDSNYLHITNDKKFKLYNNIFVVSLEPFYSSILGTIEEKGRTNTEILAEAESNSQKAMYDDSNAMDLFKGGAIDNEVLLKHLYLKLKKDNFYSFFITNHPYKLIYSKNISDKNGIFFTSQDTKEFPQPKDSNDLDPIDSELIIEKNIDSMIYINNDTTTYGSNEYFIISSGENDPDIHNTNLSFSVNKFISILELSNKETKTTIVDMNGSLYKIRMADHQGASDIVYQNWYNRKFTKHEKKLLDDLKFIEMLYFRKDKSEELINKDIADFLYYLTYYKCFKDISVLTRRECMITRSFLKDLYKFNLAMKHRKHSEHKGIHKDGVRVQCSAVDINTKTIICNIIHRKDGKKVTDQVEINKPDGFNENPEITEELHQQALDKWKAEKPSV